MIESIVLGIIALVLGVGSLYLIVPAILEIDRIMNSDEDDD